MRATHPECPVQLIPTHDSALHLVMVTCQLLDIKGDLERHEEAKELVILLATEAKDDPEIRSQVEHVRQAPIAKCGRRSQKLELSSSRLSGDCC